MELLHDASNDPPSLSKFFEALPDSPNCLFTERQHVSNSEVQFAAAALSAGISKSQATRQVFAKGENNCNGRGAEGRFRSNHPCDEECDGADKWGGAQAPMPPHVVLFLDRSIAYVVAVVAVLKAGAAFVPLDPSWPAAKILAVLKDCSPDLILTTPALLPHLQGAVNAIQTLLSSDASSGSTAWKDHFQANCTTSEVSCAGEPLLLVRCRSSQKHDTPSSVQAHDFHHFSAPNHRSSPDNIEDQLAPLPTAFTRPPSYCHILYTSGSTGQPKGVCGTQQGLLNRLRWMAEAYPYQRDEVSCFKTGVGFVDHLTELLSPLLAGVPIFIPPAKRLLESPWALLDYIEEHRITRLVAVPSLLRMLLPPWEARARAGRRSPLRLLVSSGEALPWELARRLQGALPRATILNLYGSTEVTGDVLAFDVSRHLAAEGATSSSLVPIGRPILHHQVLLLTGSQEAVQDDQLGELCVAGPGLFSGYLRNPEATRAAFFLRERAGGADISRAPADVLKVDHFYRTGDLAQRLPDGNWVWVGRKDRQVKVRGHRVQLEEVEAALRSCPLVHSVAVKAWPRRGRELALAAYVVWRHRKRTESGSAGHESDRKHGGASECEITLEQTELSASSVPGQLEAFEEEAQTAVAQGVGGGGRPGQAQPGQHVALEQLREHLRTCLLAAAIPSWIEVVSEIKLTSSGKVDYASLSPPSWGRPHRTEADSGHLKTDAQDLEVRRGVGGLFSGPERGRSFGNSSTQIDASADQPSGPPPEQSAQSEDLQAGVLRAFQQVLGVAHVGDTDDFFLVGGSSVIAAELAHLLGVDMRWVYSHRTPQRLAEALQKRSEYPQSVQEPPTDQSYPFKTEIATIKAQVQKPVSVKNRDSVVSTHVEPRSITGHAGLPEKDFLDWGSTEDRSLSDRAAAASDVILWDSDDENVWKVGVSQDEGILTKSERDLQAPPGEASVAGNGQRRSRDAGVLSVLGESPPVSFLSSNSRLWERLVQAWGPFSLTRGNRRELLSCFPLGSKTPGQDKEENREALRVREELAHLPLLRNFTLSPGLSPQPFFLQTVWQTRLGLCVDASPLLLVDWGVAPRVLIGSHAHNFACLDASTGATIWECEVGGRIEATAAVTRDGDKVVVGCYDGKIYSLDARTGSVRWSFQTGGEVKCQAVVDPWRGFAWCGSHDHNLYVLDTATETCVYSHDCGGSIYGAAAFDVNLGRAYVVTTKGHVVAFDGRSCQELWTLDLASPLFASPAVTPSGLLLCASVDGYVTAVSSSGDVSWRTRMGGPVFAGPCPSPALPGQAVICSRDGHVQGLDTQTGRQLWDLEPDVKWVGEPITASAAVDETVVIHTDGLPCPGDLTSLGDVYRLVWICGSEGTVRALAVRAHVNKREDLETKQKEASQVDSEWKGDEYNEVRRRDCEYHLSKRQHTESSAGSDLQSKSCPAVKVLAVGKLPGEVFSSPVAGGGSIYVGCRDDHVYRLDLLSAAVHDDGKL